MKKLIFASFLLLMAGWLCAQWHIDEDFEGITTLPTGWSFVDDGDGMTWRNHGNATYAHSGSRFAFVDNYFPNENADWLITPQLSISAGDSLKFYTRSWYGTESLKVYASTTGASPSNFTNQVAHIQNISTTYQQVNLSLDQFAGQSIYLAFYWECETYGIIVDDVLVGQPLVVNAELNLPDEFTFIQGESLVVDFTPFVVCTDLQNASLSVAPQANIDVQITGLNVSFSAPDYNGTQVLGFTLHDGISGQDATDDVSVVVSPPPVIDLAIQSVISPRFNEFLGMSFYPQVTILNNGAASYNNQIELSYQLEDSSGTLVSTDQTILTGDLQPGATMAIPFVNPLTITDVGDYTITFNLLNQDDNPANDILASDFSVVLRVISGGPDAFGYRFIDSNSPLGPGFDWIDISQTGTSSIMYGVDSWGGDDNFSEPIPLGFDFNFYGTQYSTAYVDINGEILLADNTWYTDYPSNGWDNDGNIFNYMYPIPGYNQMPALIAVYWDDLHADQGIGDVYFQTFGETPNRYTVVQWHNLRYHAGTGGSPQLKFQVIFYENGELKMQYHTVATGQSGSVAPHNNGASATVALQNSAANVGLCYLREIVVNNNYIGVEPAGNLLHDNLAIRFYSGEDTQPPVITHRQIGNTFNQDIQLRATILDMSTLQNKTLHYDYGTGWQSLEATANEGNIYSFELSGLPQGATIRYYFSATDALENSATLPANAPDETYSFNILPTQDTQVLIAYSGTQDYQRNELPIYENLLTELDIDYDIYDWEEYPAYTFPDQYKALFVYANTGSQGAKADTLSYALMDFLDRGTIEAPKGVWFSSDGWAGNQHAHPNASPMRKLTAGYFRTHYIATGLGGGTNGLGGPDNFNYENGTILALPGTMVGTADTEYAVRANSPDCIFPDDEVSDTYWDEVPYPEIGAIYNYAFEDGPFSGQAYLYHGVCGTQVETPIFKTMYFSFDFSQLTSLASKQEWMEDLADWFGIMPTANADNNLPGLVTKLESIYPNPFNPSTTIRFQLSQAAEISLEIYNIKGQKVATLTNGHKTAGTHTAIWNGIDNSGRKASSGIYYVRLKTPKQTESRKITLIK